MFVDFIRTHCCTGVAERQLLTLSRGDFPCEHIPEQRHTNQTTTIQFVLCRIRLMFPENFPLPSLRGSKLWVIRVSAVTRCLFSMRTLSLTNIKMNPNLAFCTSALKATKKQKNKNGHERHRQSNGPFAEHSARPGSRWSGPTLEHDCYCPVRILQAVCQGWQAISTYLCCHGRSTGLLFPPSSRQCSWAPEALRVSSPRPADLHIWVSHT